MPTLSRERALVSSRAKRNSGAWEWTQHVVEVPYEVYDEVDTVGEYIRVILDTILSYFLSERVCRAK